jgi:hypothetical protein
MQPDLKLANHVNLQAATYIPFSTICVKTVEIFLYFSYTLNDRETKAHQMSRGRNKNR